MYKTDPAYFPRFRPFLDLAVALIGEHPLACASHTATPAVRSSLALPTPSSTLRLRDRPQLRL